MVLTTKPTAKTAATKTSDVGAYKIDVAGGEAKNYGFSYVPGRLTINKAEQSIAWNQDFRGLRVGDQVELKATASSGLQVTYSMESYEPAEIYTAGTTYWLDCKAEGETQIVAVQEGNRNYYATNRIRKPLIVGPVAIVEAEDGSLVKIQSTQLGIRVTGAKPGENIRIYTLDGMREVSQGGRADDIYPDEAEQYLHRQSGRKGREAEALRDGLYEKDVSLSVTGCLAIGAQCLWG